MRESKVVELRGGETVAPNLRLNGSHPSEHEGILSALPMLDRQHECDRHVRQLMDIHVGDQALAMLHVEG